MASVAFGGQYISGKNTPAGLDKRADELVFRQNEMAKTFNSFVDILPENVRTPMIVRNDYILLNLNAAQVLTRMCEINGDGEMCDEAAQDFDQAEKELKKLEKDVTKISSKEI